MSVLESLIMLTAVSPRVSSAERRWLLAASIGVLALASLPYVAGLIYATPDRIFTGLQVNPLDGLSYLAKMREGWDGSWLFHLSYTVEQGPGAFLFTYFIALGQLARLFNLPLIVVFHLSRLVGGLALLFMAYQLIARVVDSIADRRLAWWLVALSSGLGWLATPLGHSVSSDMTIAESNTFYSLVANAHFALAAAILIAIFLVVLDARRIALGRVVLVAMLSLTLAVIQPFAPFAVYAILGGVLIVIWRRDRVFPRARFVVAVIAGLVTAPLLLYMYVATQADPVLRGWSLQNQTPSPPPVDYVIGYGLLLLFAIPGWRAAWRRRSDFDLLLLVWVVVTIPLLYAPIPLQRRLSLGLHVPIALLAAQGIRQIIRSRGLQRLAVVATFPTTLVILLALVGGAAARDLHIYVTGGEADAFNWLQAHAHPDDVVLAAPETGAFIPALAGQRVVYGHPYETVDAEHKQQQVEDFYRGTLDRSSFLRRYAINYVMAGPRERALGAIDPIALGLRPVFTENDVTLYAVGP